jgi:transposase
MLGGLSMMGPRQVAQEALFYEFSLEQHVPSDHLLRSIDRFVDLTGIRQRLAPFYSSTGRPSVDPELMIRMLLIGYCFGIRSERRLCEEVHLNLAYRWFCRLDLNDSVPDHSTFSKNRHGRFRDSDLLRHVFEATVRRCIVEGLVGGERFAVDASLVEADVNVHHATEREDWDPTTIDPDEAPRAVREYLAVLDDAAFGAASEVTSKFVAHADPAAQWAGTKRHAAIFAYSTNYLIDTDNAVIVDVETTRSIRQAETGAARVMIDRVMDQFGLYPERLIADAAYGSAPMLNWLVEEKGIEPHIPVFDKSARSDGTFERADFTYDHQKDVYICPGGKTLETRRKNYPMPMVSKDGLVSYRARKHDCSSCALKARCCPRQPHRKVLRSVYENARQMARDIAETDDYEVSCKLRKKVEMLFAHLKRILRLGRLRLRGPCGARDEFHLAAAAQNLRKLAKLIPMMSPATAC